MCESYRSEEQALIQALRLRLRRLNEQASKAKESLRSSELCAEENRAQTEALAEIERSQGREASQLLRQSRAERRHQVTLEARVEEAAAAVATATSSSRFRNGVSAQAQQTAEAELRAALWRLAELRGEGQRLRSALKEVLARPPPKVQELPRPAWIATPGDPPPRELTILSSSQRKTGGSTPGGETEEALALRQALESRRGTVSSLQAALRQEAQRSAALAQRERAQRTRGKQLEAALRRRRGEQNRTLSQLRSELQEGARHVRQLLNFAARPVFATAAPSFAGPSPSMVSLAGPNTPTLSFSEASEPAESPAACSTAAGPLPPPGSGVDEPGERDKDSRDAGSP